MYMYVCAMCELKYMYMYCIIESQGRETDPSTIWQEVERMEQSMTAVEAARLIDWLKANGHTAEEATECIKYIASGIQQDK